MITIEVTQQRHRDIVSKLAAVIGSSEEEIFWHRVDIGEQYLTKVEGLDTAAAKMVMAERWYWNWFNLQIDNLDDEYTSKMGGNRYFVLSAELQRNSYSCWLEQRLNDRTMRESFQRNYHNLVKKQFKIKHR